MCCGFLVARRKQLSAVYLLLNTFTARRNDHHFTDDICKRLWMKNAIFGLNLTDVYSVGSDWKWTALVKLMNRWRAETNHYLNHWWPFLLIYIYFIGSRWVSWAIFCHIFSGDCRHLSNNMVAPAPNKPPWRMRQCNQINPIETEIITSTKQRKQRHAHIKYNILICIC